MAVKDRALKQVIRETRKKAGLTQKALADLAGVGKTLIFDLEQGHETIQFEKLKRIFRVLNIKIKIEPPVIHAQSPHLR